MKMIAKTLKGKEFIYSKTHCYRVSEKGAVDICNALNEIRYNLKEGEIWHIYNCGSYELDFTNAGVQKLTRYKGTIKAVRSYA